MNSLETGSKVTSNSPLKIIILPFYKQRLQNFLSNPSHKTWELLSVYYKTPVKHAFYPVSSYLFPFLDCNRKCNTCLSRCSIFMILGRKRTFADKIMWATKMQAVLDLYSTFIEECDGIQKEAFIILENIYFNRKRLLRDIGRNNEKTST